MLRDEFRGEVVIEIARLHVFQLKRGRKGQPKIKIKKEAIKIKRRGRVGEQDVNNSSKKCEQRT